jgi:hypothetical protein
VQWELQNKILTLFGTQNRANVNFNSWEFFPRFGVPILENGKLRVGHAWQNHTDSYFRNEVQASRNNFDRLNFAGQSTFLTLRKSTIQNKMYGDQGRSIYMSARYNRGTINYNAGGSSELDQQFKNRWFQARLQYERMWQPEPQLSVGLSVDAAFSDLPAYPTETGTRLASPKFTPLQDSPILFEKGLYSKLFVAPGFRFNYHFWDDFTAHFEAHWMQSFEELSTNKAGDLRHIYTFNTQNRMIVGSTGLTYETTLGPIGAFVNFYEDPAGPFRVFMHVGYLIFSKHPWR